MYLNKSEAQVAGPGERILLPGTPAGAQVREPWGRGQGSIELAIPTGVWGQHTGADWLSQFGGFSKLVVKHSHVKIT